MPGGQVGICLLETLVRHVGMQLGVAQGDEHRRDEHGWPKRATERGEKFHVTLVKGGINNNNNNVFKGIR